MNEKFGDHALHSVRSINNKEAWCTTCRCMIAVTYETASKRGFASLTPERRREIASKGGKAVHAKGTAHTFDSEQGRIAGRKGGKIVSNDTQHMKEIGRIGGKSRAAQRKA